MEIKLDAEAVSSIAASAIFDSMSQEVREGVVKQAVQHLLTPESNRGFGHGKTPLQMAFDLAISQAAYKVVQEKVANDPQVIAKIEELLGPMLNGILVQTAGNYNDELGSKIGEAMGNWINENARRARG